MRFLNKLALTFTHLLLLSSVIFFQPLSSVMAGEENTAKNVSLKVIMQGLLNDTKMITEGIFLENYPMIEKGAKQIAQHPQVPMETRKKLLKALGSEMGQFKGFDMKVHNTAVSIAQAAKNNNMEAILSNYHQLIDGCQYCHESFKQRTVEILK